MKPLKIIFAGTPAFSLPCLQAIHRSEHEIIAVFTQPDRPAGRGQKLQPSIIKQWAINNDLPIFQPQTLKSAEIQQTIHNLNPDLMIVIAYGLILPKAVLDIPKHGCINVHGSLLPRWRGAAPVQYAIREGDEVTGITTMLMDVGMDTGDMLKKIHCKIEHHDTSETLLDKLSHMSAPLLIDTIDQWVNGTLIPIKQNESEVTYAHKIEKTDAKINWHETSNQILQKIRAYIPWPIAYAEWQNQAIKIHQAHNVALSSSAIPGTVLKHDTNTIVIKTGNGAIAITHWQWPNHKMMPVHDWLQGRSHELPEGTVLA
ncbi:MAG: methionyl-tRNA formyltransferase [Gammaproteobacteria bacterium]|nr:methionyl-tRNA formyltransferase [Gammaproteobacteria bacterium]